LLHRRTVTADETFGYDPARDDAAAPPRGRVRTALTRVTMVGSDMQLDTGVGTCGKDGQSVPVGVGQPTLRIEKMTVGGTR